MRKFNPTFRSKVRPEKFMLSSNRRYDCTPIEQPIHRRYERGGGRAGYLLAIFPAEAVSTFIWQSKLPNWGYQYILTCRIKVLSVAKEAVFGIRGWSERSPMARTTSK